MTLPKPRKYWLNIVAALIIIFNLASIYFVVDAASSCNYEDAEVRQSFTPENLAEIDSKSHQWSNFRGNFLNSGQTETSLNQINQDQDRRPWQFSTQGLIWSTPVVDSEGNVLVGSADKKFYKLTSEGDLVWSYEIYDEPDALIDSAAVLTESNLVVIPGGDGFIHALDINSGERVWDFEAYHANASDGSIVNAFEGNVTQGPNGLLYAGSDNGHMYALDQNGQEIWNFQTNFMVWSSPAFDPKGAWMTFGSLDGCLYLLNPNTGELYDALHLDSEVKSSPSYDQEKRLIYVGTSGGNLVALEPRVSGDSYKLTTKWRFATGGEVYSSPAQTSEGLSFGSLDGKLYRLDNNGKLLWSFNTYSTISSSPTVTADGKVIFGGGNGTIYALDVKSGERVWSYQVTDSNIKNNLDASVVIGKNGYIYAASYNGQVYGLPAEYCLNNPKDPACEFGGVEDLPNFGGSVPEDGSIFKWQDNQGNLHPGTKTEHNPSSPLRWRLLAFDEGKYLSRASINPLNLNVTIEPSVDFEYKVSTDGRYLNVLPTSFWEAETDYEIEITGEYYLRESWLWDRFKWFGLETFEHTVSFSTSPKESDEFFQHINLTNPQFGLDSLFLFQPQSLETYTPAALDGQQFVGVFFGQTDDNFNLLLLPAFREGDGFEVLPEPSRVVRLEGSFYGQSLRGDGAFEISAMGGTIPFEDVTFSGTIDPDRSFEEGEFFAQASCLGLQGNGTSFEFSPNLVDETCDHELNLIGMGKNRGVFLQKEESQILEVAKSEEINNRLKLEFNKASDFEGEQELLTIVSYNPETGEILDLQSTVLNQLESQWTFEVGTKNSDNYKNLIFLGRKEVKID